MAVDLGDDISQEVFDRLCERFPSAKPERVAQVLSAYGGHAGQAAAKLRDLMSSGVRQADPEDAEHVKTLLSSPLIIGEVCRQHFRMFDENGNGFLEWNEILALTNALHESFGLPLPREGGLRSFFDSADANSDGTLAEEEFYKFFESFLQFAFCTSPKQRRSKEMEIGTDQPPLSRSSTSAGTLSGSGSSNPSTPEGAATPSNKRGGKRFIRFWDAVQESKNGEVEWRESTRRLQERFPNIRPEYIEKAFRDSGGHAGEAASVLRSLSRCQSVL